MQGLAFAEIQPFLGPVARMVALSPELSEALEIGRIGLRSKPGTKNEVAGLDTSRLIRFHIPLIPLGVKPGCSDAGIELDVFLEAQF
jgi:hypothetical protein